MTLLSLQPSTVAVENTSDAASVEASSDVWFLDEGIQGQGPRPEWLNSKYATATAQAKAQVELEKRIGSVGLAAPEAYDFGEHASFFDAANPAISNMIGKAKNHRLSQEAFSDLMGSVVEYQKSQMPDELIETEKLGPNPAARLNTIKTWLENNLSQRSLDAVVSVPHTAEFIEFIDEMRQLHVNMASQMPSGAHVPHGAHLRTEQEIHEEKKANFQRYLSDKAYREKLTAELEQIIGKD